MCSHKKRPKYVVNNLVHKIYKFRSNIFLIIKKNVFLKQRIILNTYIIYSTHCINILLDKKVVLKNVFNFMKAKNFN